MSSSQTSSQRGRFCKPKICNTFSLSIGFLAICQSVSPLTFPIISQLSFVFDPGPDNLHPKLLVETKDTIVKPLTKLFKTSIKTNTLPSDWKEAYGTPIFKKGSKKKPENYKPISLTSVP